MDKIRSGLLETDSSKEAQNPFSVLNANPFSISSPLIELEGEPTIFKRIVFKDGKYIPVGLDPYFDTTMYGRITWMNQTNGGRNIPPGDNSMYAHEAFIQGLPSKVEGSGIKSSKDQGFKSKSMQYAWLGDRTNMLPTGVDDQHKCCECMLVLSDFVPGDTLLSQHVYFTNGECPYLKANYTPARLKIEIGLERFRRGFIAHPEAVIVPDAWKVTEVGLTNRIYVKLATYERCYMCGSSPGEHASDCYKKMRELIQKVHIGLQELKL